MHSREPPEPRNHGMSIRSELRIRLLPVACWLLGHAAWPLYSPDFYRPGHSLDSTCDWQLTRSRRNQPVSWSTCSVTAVSCLFALLDLPRGRLGNGPGHGARGFASGLSEKPRMSIASIIYYVHHMIAGRALGPMAARELIEFLKGVSVTRPNRGLFGIESCLEY
jgi:hypothetical protein